MIKNYKLDYIYIHIPFCRSFCEYCAFYKENYTKEKFNLYIEKLKAEFEENKVISKVKTIYIGGGTPNTLSITNLKKIFSLIEKNLQFQKRYEFTVECNPSDVCEEKIALFVKNKVNRVSIGIQSTNQNIINDVARIQNSEDIKRTLMILKKYPFLEYSFDFIYNLPNQTINDLKNDLGFIKKFKPMHISWYSLILKKGTPLKRRYKKINVDKDFEFGNFIEKELKKMNYHRYEISNYALKKEYESEHNKAYWKSKLFLAYGPSGSSFLFDKEKQQYYLKKNSEKIDSWSENITLLSKNDYYFQIMMMGLRLIKGINIGMQPNKNAFDYYSDKINKEIKSGYLIIEDLYLKCTDKGLLILNDILIRLL